MGDLPPWASGKAAKRRQNARSGRLERSLAQEVGGTVTAGSGSSWASPQDVREESHLIQHKYTDKGSFSVTIRDWRRIRRDAHNFGRDPALVIDFEQHGIRLLVVEAPTPGGEGPQVPAELEDERPSERRASSGGQAAERDEAPVRRIRRRRRVRADPTEDR